MKYLFVALVMVAALCGCSSSPDSVAEDTLRQKIENESHGSMKVVSFQKLDGEDRSMLGVQARRIEYEVQVEFIGPGTWLSRGMPGQLRYQCSDHIYVSPNSIAGMVNDANGAIVYRSGDRATIRGSMTGRKKDSGWHFDEETARIVSPPTPPQQ